MKRITIGRTTLDLHWFTGRVLNASKSRETKVHGGGGGGTQGSSSPVHVYSTTTVHDQLILAGKHGAERAFQLQNFDVACRETNELSVVWAVKAGKDFGPYVFVYNHTTKDGKINTDAIRKLVGPSWLGCASVVVFALVLMAIVFKVKFPTYREYLWLIGVATYIGSIVWYVHTGRRRVRLFRAALDPQEMES